MTKYPEPTNERGAIARLVCMADDLAAEIATTTRAFEQLRDELQKLCKFVTQEYPDDDNPLAYKRIVEVSSPPY